MIEWVSRSQRRQANRRLRDREPILEVHASGFIHVGRCLLRWRQLAHADQLLLYQSSVVEIDIRIRVDISCLPATAAER